MSVISLSDAPKAMEWSKHADKQPPAPSRCPSQAVLHELAAPAGEHDARALIAALDADADGAVSLAELTAFQRMVRGRGSAHP